MASVVQRLPWPLPALMAWLVAWSLFALGLFTGIAAWPAAAAATLAGIVVAAANRAPWRRLCAALGFPLSASLAGLAAWPPWAWGLGGAVLLLLYPLRTWRDAPWFPTPHAALAGLDRAALPAPRRALDAGCGLGHGLAALHALWPATVIEGVECSRPMAWLSAWRCPWARVLRGDMWSLDWGRHDLVYLFQRPESMTRAWSKADAEMAPGSWLVSLDFPVPGRQARHVLHGDRGRPVWIYRLGDAPVRSTGVPPGR